MTALAALAAVACGGCEATPAESPQASGGSTTEGPSTSASGSGGSAGSHSGVGGAGGLGTGGSMGATTGATTGTAGGNTGSTGETSGSSSSAQGSTGGAPTITVDGCGPVNVDASAIDPATAGRIVVLGSSTAAGQNASSADNSWVGRYRSYLAEAFPNFTIDNLGMGGFNTYRIQPSDYVPPEGRPSPMPGNNITTALERDPDAIIINLPSNDLYEGFSLEEQMGNYERVVTLAQEQGALVWIATAQPRDFAEAAQRQGLMEARDAIRERFAPRAVDFWTDLANSDGTMKSIYNSGDGTHFNDAGHAVLAQMVITCAIPEVILSSGE
ncbi:MAG TPA: SGNH/GDSL hydrolase family protein [Polyangiaceae bacterium]|nr:SGNH/GDSL hydrolase family protein [Polyangiaceae bacterium]